MAKRALVLGSQVRGLTGVHTDTRRVVAMLLQRGFTERDIDLRQAASGTRAGMLEGFDRLIAGCREGDLAFVYYSGHGAHVENADWSVAGPRRFQCIIPTDIGESTDEDFRGISSWELSIKQAALTARTRNVVVALDCCHSAQMSRDGAGLDAVPRALPHPIRLGLARYFAALRDEQRSGLDQLDPLANPDAVRLVACGLTEAAFECTMPDGSRSGVFTDSLLDVLDQVGEASISWATVGSAVRRRVLARIPVQRPDVEGPAHRRLFSLVELDGRGHVPVWFEGDHAQLLAGRLSGVSTGDVYDIEALGASSAEGHPIARATVTAVTATTAVAELDESRGAREPLPVEAVAVPVELAAARRLVAIDAPDDDRARIAAALGATGALGPATDEDAELLLATLRLGGGLLTVEDHLGPLGAPRSYPDDLDGAVRALVDMAVAQGIRDLVGSHGVDESEVEIELGTVEDGAPRPMPASGGALALGDRIYVRLRNATAGAGPERRLYAHVLNIGLGHRVSLLTSEAPSGVALDPGAPAYLLAEGLTPGRLHGLELSWPDGLPRDTARLDELFVVVTTARTNLQGLETHDAVGRASLRGQSALGTRLAQLADGQARDAGRRRPVTDDFLVHRLSYLLHPRRGRLAGLDFAVDEEPLNQRGGRAARAWLRPAHQARSLDRPSDGKTPVTPAEAASRIAIRLGDLVVESNRALLAADIRIDALVCTLSRPDDAPYVVQTMRFPRIKDGERLPLDRALLYHGPVREFVDICLWVSRDTTDSRALADLLRDKATSPELKDATSALLSAAGLSTPWITAVGASAVLARIAYDLILGVAGKTIGLYRTSFLAGEGFGVGRHPVESLYRAQDFSFSLLIDPIAPERAR